MSLNADIITIVFLGMMLITGVLVVFTERLINAAIYMGTLSTITAVVFLLLGAPDVAIAEAIIGSTLSTIIYLIAIKKYRMFTIYHIIDAQYDTERKQSMDKLSKRLGLYLKSREMNMHIIHTDESLDNLSGKEENSLILEHCASGIMVHCHMVSEHNDNITQIISSLNLKDRVIINNDIMTPELSYREEEL